MFSTGAGIAVTDPQHVQSSTIFHSMSPTDVADWEKHRSGVDCQVCLSKKNATVQLEASWVQPMKMNYEVHGNTAPHLHVHFFPRYRGDQFEGGPINPRAALRPVYGPGEFEHFRERLKSELTSRAV